MDLTDLQSNVPPMPGWLKGLEPTLQEPGPLPAALERHWLRLAARCLAGFGEVAARERASLDLVLRNAVVLAREKAPELLPPMYLVALAADRGTAGEHAALVAQVAALVALRGWWSVFPGLTLPHVLARGFQGLPPGLEFRLRLAFRTDQGGAPSARTLLADLEAFPDVPRRDLARSVRAHVLRNGVRRRAPAAAFAALQLKVQVLLLDSPPLFQALFGRGAGEAGIDAAAVRGRWAVQKAFARTATNLCTFIRGRRWEDFDACLQRQERIPEDRDLHPFHAPFREALASPGPAAAPGALPPEAGLRLERLIGRDPGGIRLVRFLSSPVNGIVRAACLRRSYLAPGCPWLPLPDRAALIGGLAPGHVRQLALAQRFDLLPEDWIQAIPGIARPLTAFLHRKPVQDGFVQALSQGLLKRKGIASLARALSGENGKRAARVIRRSLPEVLDRYWDKDETLGTFIAALKSAGAVGVFQKIAGNESWGGISCCEALAKLARIPHTGLWFDWLMNLDRHQYRSHIGWSRALERILDHSAGLRMRFLLADDLEDRLSLFHELPPALRISMLQSLLVLDRKPRGPGRDRARKVLQAVLASAAIPDALLVARGCPDLKETAQERLARHIPAATPEEVVRILEALPRLAAAFGRTEPDDRFWSQAGPRRPLLVALLAAFRPRRYWRRLEELPSGLRAGAIGAALPFLAPFPTRRAMLELAQRLGLRWLPTLAAAFAAMREGGGGTGERLDHLYRTFALPKKSGGTRVITVPPPWIKRLQRAVLDTILAPLGAHPCAHGFVRGRGIVSNAGPHAGQALVVSCDIRSAFPSVSWALVRHALRRDLGQTLSAAAVSALADLCCHGGGLPIGAPTSPALLNRVLAAADQVLAGEAERRGVAYTRYADDLCFSGDGRARELLPIARRLLASAGLALDPRKTHLFRRGRRQMVTGLVVNDRISAPRHLRRKLRAAVHRLEQGRQPHWQGSPMGTPGLMGRLGFVRMVHPGEAARLVRRLRAAMAHRACPGGGPS